MSSNDISMLFKLPDGNVLTYRYVKDNTKGAVVVAITGWEKIINPLYIPETIHGAKVKVMNDEAFKDCLELKEVYLPDSIETILPAAFSGCSNLEKIHLSNNLKTIQSHSFEQCKRLKELILPDSVTTIGSMAFFGCRGLENVTLGKELKILDYAAFNCCSSLKSLTFNKKLQSVGIAFLYGCSQLAEIKVPRQNGYFSSIDGVLFSKNGEALIKYPPSKQRNIYNVPDNVVNIHKFAFHNAKIKEVKLHENIKFIEYRTFLNIRSVTPFCLKCPPGSYAEAYAQNHKINYKPTMSEMENFFNQKLSPQISSFAQEESFQK